MGIYKRRILRKKERKHAFDQEKSKTQEKRNKIRILTKISTKKKKVYFFSFINSHLRIIQSTKHGCKEFCYKITDKKYTHWIYICIYTTIGISWAMENMKP